MLLDCPTANSGPLPRVKPHWNNVNRHALILILNLRTYSWPEGHCEPRNKTGFIGLVKNSKGNFQSNRNTFICWATFPVAGQLVSWSQIPGQLVSCNSLVASLIWIILWCEKQPYCTQHRSTSIDLSYDSISMSERLYANLIRLEKKISLIS